MKEKGKKHKRSTSIHVASYRLQDRTSTVTITSVLVEIPIRVVLNAAWDRTAVHSTLFVYRKKSSPERNKGL